MKKLYVLLFIGVIIFTGCGGGGNHSGTGYQYKWSNGITTLTYTKAAFNSVVYADGPGYIGSEIPPFSGVDDGGRMGSTLLIFTYYNGDEVKSVCTSTDGQVADYDLGGHTAPSFIANSQGLFNITATYNGETINIPVRIYHFGGIDLDFADLDGDGNNDIFNFSALYGYQVINNAALSLVSSAPVGEYVQTPLPDFTYGKIYVIKTSSGKYCKVYPTGAAGGNNYNSMNFLSDVNGNFDY
jgi:hypothetical protein